MITCQNCATANHDGAVFCDKCGQELTPAQVKSVPTAPPQLAVQRAPLTPYAISPGQAPDATLRTPPVRIRLRLPDGHTFTVYGKDEYVIGRHDGARQPPDVDLANVGGLEAGVSRLHVMIRVGPDGVFVEDLESRNETVHNGYRLLPRQWYPLHHGDELKLGAITLYVTFERP